MRIDFSRNTSIEEERLSLRDWVSMFLAENTD
jgi:hypothetical protein